MRSFFTDHVNSILGAVIIHLLVVLAFFWTKLGEMDELNEEVMVEIVEDVPPPEDKNELSGESSEDFGETMQSLDRQTLHNIASNVASKLDPEISTNQYEKQVLEELGIGSLEAPGSAMEKAVQQETDENAIEQQQNETKKNQEDMDVPNIIRKDNTTVSYFLEGRWHKYIYIPTYKCQGGGTVFLDIIINPSGRVISALIQENKSTADPCLREEAYRSAVSAQFNANQSSSAKQLGTITYVFLPQ